MDDKVVEADAPVKNDDIAAMYKEEMMDAPAPSTVPPSKGGEKEEGGEEGGAVEAGDGGDGGGGERGGLEVAEKDETAVEGLEDLLPTVTETERKEGAGEEKKEEKEKVSKKKKEKVSKKKKVGGGRGAKGKGEGGEGKGKGRGGTGRQRSPTPKAVAAAEGEDGMVEEKEEEKCTVTCVALTSRTQTQCKRPPLAGGIYCKVHQEAANKSENGIKNFDPNATKKGVGGGGGGGAKDAKDATKDGKDGKDGKKGKGGSDKKKTGGKDAAPPPQTSGGKDERPVPTLAVYSFPEPPKPTVILKQPFNKWLGMKVQLEAGSYKGLVGRITKIYGGIKDEYTRESGLIHADVFCEITMGDDEVDEDGKAKKKNQYMTKVTTTRRAKELTPIIKNERGRGMRKVKKTRKIEVVEEEIAPPEDMQPKRIKISGLGTGKKKGLPGWEDPEPGVSPYANKFIRVGEKYQCNVPTMKRFNSQAEYTGERNTLGGNVKAHWKSAFKRNEIDREEKEDKNYKGGQIWDPKWGGEETKSLFEGYSTSELDEVMKVYREEKEKEEGGGDDTMRRAISRYNDERYFKGFVEVFEGRTGIMKAEGGEEAGGAGGETEKKRKRMGMLGAKDFAKAKKAVRCSEAGVAKFKEWQKEKF
ncbi:hypothetical protein TrST_g10678 [Triparma strigata]|uniref:Uncharacterized protein n=1 Tax=Triparma strigata TaxID=1606541 RepID=A0A9W7C3L8_9STRA|nr:hypothetical protein TrST_g10678 [Triparma strigata]